MGKIRWLPWPLIGWDIFDFSSETAGQNSTKLDRKQDLNFLYHVRVLQADRKNKMAAWPLIGWDIFDFPETAERPAMKLDRKKDLNVLYQVCVFGPIGKTSPGQTVKKVAHCTQVQCTRYVILWASCLKLASVILSLYRSYTLNPDLLVTNRSSCRRY